MGIVRTQSKSLGTDSTTGNSIAVTLNSAVAAGSRILVYGEWGSAPGATAITGVTDTLNLTVGWADIVASFAADSNGPNAGDVWENKNSVGGAAPTVTVNLSSALGFRAIIVHVLSGAEPTLTADKATARAIASGTSHTSAAVTPSVNGEYICGFCLNDTNNTVLPSSNSPFGAVVEESGNGSTLQIAASQDFVQGAAASVNATFSYASAVTGAVHLVTIRPALVSVAVGSPIIPRFLPLNKIMQIMTTRLGFTTINPPPPPSGGSIIERRTFGIMNSVGTRRAK